MVTGRDRLSTCVTFYKMDQVNGAEDDTRQIFLWRVTEHGWKEIESSVCDMFESETLKYFIAGQIYNIYGILLYQRSLILHMGGDEI